jgi:hypothetical protein
LWRFIKKISNMKKLIAFSALSFWFLACQPKTDNNAPANTPPAATTIPVASVQPQTTSKPMRVELKDIKSNVDNFAVSYAYAVSLEPASEPILEELRKNMAMFYFNTNLTEAEYSQKLAAISKDGSVRLGVIEPTYNEKGLLSLKNNINADMDPVVYAIFDLHTGKQVAAKDLVDVNQLQDYFKKKSESVKDAQKLNPRSKISLEIQYVYLTPKGLTAHCFMTLTPDDDEFCAGDDCFFDESISFADLSPLLIPNSPLAR